MYSRSKHIFDNTYTPKRRRLGTLGTGSRVLRQSFQVLQSPNVRDSLSLDNLDDPPLPCNQEEYLSDSRNTSSTSSDIPCSPGVFDCSIMKNVENWDSLVVSKNLNNVTNEISTSICKELNEIEDISNEMFISKLEQESTQYNRGTSSTSLTTRCHKHFKDNIQDSFNVINKSIYNLNNEKNNIDENFLFETKDSFLLDIKESSIVLQKKETKCDAFSKPKTMLENRIPDDNSFYGLPMTAKDLFKSYRNIEKFYDWQEECLNLKAIKERHNLIYALPTSGGKTLVAEVLMLREVLNMKRNALFILPFVAIVQEKMCSLAPFAVQLDFLVEEYAGGKGHIPPVKRRKKNSIYIATIEKGLALVRSLIELDRLGELGLIVVDELHLIGEPGRGGTLETLLSTVMFTKQDIHIVGMSATIGNLDELARFLRAEVFARDFRPVQLAEYVKLGDVLHRLQWTSAGLEVVPDRQLAFDYSSAGASADPDLLGGLVSEVVPQGSCLVFCPTKRNCENVAALLCKLQRREMTVHRTAEREALACALRGEGAAGELARCVRGGVAYHHAGLAQGERALLEHAFRCGVISVVCCTSTLAAGVNLPARRVIVRAPLVGRQPLSLAAYRQMAGRAGRAGICETGESIIICGAREWPQLRAVLAGGLGAARSALPAAGVGGLLLSAVSLRLATAPPRLRDLLHSTLMATQAHRDATPLDIKGVCDDSLRSLVQSGALEVSNGPAASRASAGDCLDDDSELAVSCLGRAAIKGCMELSVVKQLLEDLETASRALVLMDSLHLLYLVTPHDAAGVRPDYRHYYSLYCDLDEEGIQTAKTLGITEMNAIRMITGKPITNVPESVLRRFYLALMLNDLWKQMPLPDVADKYCVSRGTVQSVMTSSASFAWGAHRVCEALPPRWAWRALLGELAARLQACAAPELTHLMELPAVHKARAMQLMRAGYKRIEDLAKASVDDLVLSITHLSRKAANLLVNSARMMLIEKVENLRAEAEDVMAELNF